MSQPGVLNHSTGFLPHFDGLKRVPLTLWELVHLYELTDWRVVLLDGRIDMMYQEFFAVSMFKALALPYLIPIPSERALARELKEREPLQALCGFLPGKTPTRATFWHFRNKYSKAYPELMLRVLIALVLSGSEPNLTLPFVTPISQTTDVPSGHYSKFQLDVYRPPIEVWTVPEAEPSIVAPDKSWAQLSREIREWSSRKRGLAGGTGLPAEVRTKLYNDQTIRFGIDRPDWIHFRTEADTLTTVGAASFRPYTVCHVLVIREHENQRQVLLSRRLAGYGKGTYMLPGGKQQPGESLQDCAARELWEETWIRLRKSRPVSLHNTRLPGKPRVLSVGVLAENYQGAPQHREPSQGTEWQWFNLNELPKPLFEPARVVISHYINETYPDLQWSDVESQIPQAQEPTEQLTLPISV